MSAEEGPDMLSAAEIADEIVRTRARLSHSLMVLDREYALRNAFVHGTRLLHGTQLDPGNMREAVRRHILPLSLIGIGLVWLTLAGRQENTDVAGRFLRGLAHVQRLGRELLAFVGTAQAGELATMRGKDTAGKQRAG